MNTLLSDSLTCPQSAIFSISTLVIWNKLHSPGTHPNPIPAAYISVAAFYVFDMVLRAGNAKVKIYISDFKVLISMEDIGLNEHSSLKRGEKLKEFL